MLVLGEKCKLNRRIFEQGLIHISFNCIVHLESNYLVSVRLSRILRKGKRASPDRRPHKVDHQADDKLNYL